MPKDGAAEGADTSGTAAQVDSNGAPEPSKLDAAQQESTKGRGGDVKMPGKSQHKAARNKVRGRGGGRDAGRFRGRGRDGRGRGTQGTDA